MPPGFVARWGSCPTGYVFSTLLPLHFIAAAMAPYINAHESAIDSDVDTIHVKSKVGVGQVKLEATAKPPVADGYMYDFKYNHELPTTNILGIEVPADCDAQKEAETIVSGLSEVLGRGDAQGFTDMFLEYSESRVLSNLVPDDLQPK